MTKMGDRKGISAKASMVEKRLGATTGAAKGHQNIRQPKMKAKVLGGLKPSGVKLSKEWKF